MQYPDHRFLPQQPEALTIDVAFANAYGRLRGFCRSLYERDDVIAAQAAMYVNDAAFRLTQDLVRCGVPSPAAFELARPSSSE